MLWLQEWVDVLTFLSQSHRGPENLGGPTGDGVAGVLMNARKELHVEYFGKNAHAGGNPWDGVNALDALVQAYNGISTLRKQILPEERIHGAFLDVPKVANVIPAYTNSYWQVRSPTLQGLNKLIAQVRQCIEGRLLSLAVQPKSMSELPSKASSL